MPPKDQVAQLIVTTDPYSAQFHEVGFSRVDVITKPGFGQWEGRTQLNFSSDALSAPYKPGKQAHRDKTRDRIVSMCPEPPSWGIINLE